MADKDVLLVERFDRVGEENGTGWRRKAKVSALTFHELDEMTARYASYENLATIVRDRFSAPKQILRELFSRMFFNNLCRNTDDHARNHAAFWTGHGLSLTPAYDICPKCRTGGEATQVMLIARQNRKSQVAVCLKAASIFMLSEKDAIGNAKNQIVTIKDQWFDMCVRRHG